MPKELEVGFYIAVGLVAFFLYRKRKPLPTKLDLSGFKTSQKRSALGKIRRVEAELVDDAPTFNKSNIFTYRGKKYDAYSVLAVPVGASPKEIKQAYAHRLVASPERAELLQKAYETVR